MHVYLNRYTTDNSSLIYYTLGHSSHNVSQKKISSIFYKVLSCCCLVFLYNIYFSIQVFVCFFLFDTPLVGLYSRVLS
jgi:hypothetical protein